MVPPLERACEPTRGKVVMLRQRVRLDDRPVIRRTKV